MENKKMSIEEEIVKLTLGLRNMFHIYYNANGQD
jgi:hypothetical protein